MTHDDLVELTTLASRPDGDPLREWARVRLEKAGIIEPRPDAPAPTPPRPRHWQYRPLVPPDGGGEICSAESRRVKDVDVKQ